MPPIMTRGYLRDDVIPVPDGAEEFLKPNSTRVDDPIGIT